MNNKIQDNNQNNHNKIIVGYARVSSREQADNSKALEQQQARLKDAGVAKIFTDIQSGSRNNRPEFLKLIKSLKNGEFEAIIATRIDRLARSLPKLNELVNLCLEFDVSLKILDQNIDFNTPQGKFMVNLLGSLAEFETDMLSQRVLQGVAYRQKQEKACKSCPWGYAVVNDKYQLNNQPFLCLIEQRPDNYLELAENDLAIEILPGLTIAQIARELVLTFLKEKGLARAIKTIYAKYGIMKCSTKKNGNDGILNFTTSPFRKWLTNPVLQGHTVYNKNKTVAKNQTVANDPSQWKIIENTHPDHVLVSPSELIEIKRIIEFNRKIKPPTYNSKFEIKDDFSYLNGLVYCRDCSSKCITKNHASKDGQTKYKYFACRHAKMGCSNLTSIKKEVVEQELIKAFLSKQNVDTAETDVAIIKHSEHLLELENTLAQLTNIPYFNPEIEAAKTKIRQEIELEKNPFRGDTLLEKTVAELISLGNNYALWYSISHEEKVDIYPRLIKKIKISNGSVISVEFNV